jgi:membrane protein YqaA with SNARE-associated domain
VTTNWLLPVAFAWGFAEATFFFIVPDVCLTFIALASLQTAFEASLFALVGALAGGCVMYLCGSSRPEAARRFLTRIPGIRASLIGSVRLQLQAGGLFAILLGPLRGTPYKIYAAEWGALGRSFAGFLLISIPARYPRFLLSLLAAAALREFVSPLMLGVLWLAFYCFYFWKFGWLSIDPRE